MTQSKTGRKALALFLAMMMLFSLLPASAMAEDPVTEEEIIEEGNEDSFIEDEIFEEEIIEEEPVYEEELFFEEEQPAEETEEVDEEAGLSLTDSETFDGLSDAGGTGAGGRGTGLSGGTTETTPDAQWSGDVSYTSNQTFDLVEVTGNTTLTISNGVTVTINTYLAMDNSVKLTVTGGGTLSVTAGQYLPAVSGSGYSIVVDNATVNLTGGSYAYAITGGTISIAEGSTGTITADSVSQSGKSYSGAALSVQVTAAPATVAVTGVTLDKTTLTVGEERTATLIATVTPENATDPKVRWSTGANKVALYADSECTTEVGTNATDKLTVYVKGESAGTTTITVTVEGNDAESATCSVTVLEPVRYLTGEGSASNYCNEYTVVTGATDQLNDGWYVVPADTTVDKQYVRMTVTGNVHLILCDGATLKNGGITVQDSNSLTIYAQSAGESAGRLIANGSGSVRIAGIGAMSNEGASGNAGTITINGGKITAYGGEYSAGIGGASNNNNIHGNGGTVTINGGEVTAIGGTNAAAIGAGSGGSDPGTVTLGDGMIAFAGADNLNTEYIANFAENHGQKYAHVYAGEAPAPTFDETHSLTLGGEIGVIFFVKPNGVDISGGTMTFQVKGKEDTIVNASYATVLSDGRYKFAAYVPSIMMAEPITATFTCGDTTITDEYSVLDYTNKFDTLDADDLANFGEANQNIVKRMADYGHYIQLFLMNVRGWDFDKYAEMTKSYNSYTAEGDTNSIRDVLNKVAAYAIQRGTNTNLQSVGYTLVMDSKTSIKVYLTPIDGFSGTVTATLDNGTENVAVQEGNRYVVTISDIAAHELGNTHSIKVNAGGVESITTVSALSYVDTIMNHNTYKTDVNANNAMAALYYYSAAVPSA